MGILGTRWDTHAQNIIFGSMSSGILPFLWYEIRDLNTANRLDFTEMKMEISKESSPFETDVVYIFTRIRSINSAAR